MRQPKAAGGSLPYRTAKLKDAGTPTPPLFPALLAPTPKIVGGGGAAFPTEQGKGKREIKIFLKTRPANAESVMRTQETLYKTEVFVS